MSKLGPLLWKDVLAEARSLERTTTLGLFAAVVLITLHFALPPGSAVRSNVAGGFLWATVVLASLLELRRSFESERRDGTLDGLRAAPIDPGLLYASKAISNLLVLGLLVCVLVPVTAVIFVGRTAGIGPAIGVGLLGAAGLVGWGTLFAAMLGGTRGGEAVLPVLLFPLVVPQTIACVRLLSHYLTGDAGGDPATGFVILVAFAALSIGTSLVLFDYVLDE
jgi:heme exporter protein CcmB